MPTNPVQFYIAAGLAVASFSAGWAVNGWRYQSREAKALSEAIKERDAANERANGLAADYELARVALGQYSVDAAGRVKVIYRDRKVSIDCALPADAIGLLNAARLNANSAIAGKSSSPMPADTARSGN